jgi:hypothetical protein
MAPNPKTAWADILGNRGTRAGVRPQRRLAEPTGITVADAVADFLATAHRGVAHDRYGRVFSEHALGELSWCLRGYVDARLGTVDLNQVRRPDIEALVHELGAAGLSRRHLRAVVKSVRALYDDAIARGVADHNPAERVAIPGAGDAEQPTRGRSRARVSADRAIGLAIQGATVCFALLALLFIAESL